MTQANTPFTRGSARVLTVWDLVAVLLVLGTLVLLAQGSRGLLQPLPEPGFGAITLDPLALPQYALLTSLRMLGAMVLSLLFTFTYATWAAKSRRAEQVLIPLLDILQSVPILGFISVTVVFFMSLAPGRMLGAEMAAVFAIFTSQAWNMAFSFYQSLRTIPKELTEASRSFRLSPWMRFWKLEAPFAMPALVWNMMMSMAGGWFFVVASEAISVGDTTVILPGIGSYIALAIAQRDLAAIFWAIGTMLVVILIFDQLLFRPLVAWADRFRFEQGAGAPPPRSWVITMLRRSHLVARAVAPLANAWRRTYRPIADRPRPAPAAPKDAVVGKHWSDRLWYGAIAAICLAALWWIGTFVLEGVTLSEVGTAGLLGLATMVRVFVLIALASLIWVPVGVWLGLRPEAARIAQPIAQFMAAFPANLLFPLAVSAIVVLGLDPDIWLSPLMILGTQWYILFNVVAGASTIPSELRDIGTNFHVKGWLWWRRIALPAVFPFYMTGAITASGGSWNASIVAEIATWGDTTLKAHGLGAYIAEATDAGDFHRIVLGIAVMSAFVVVINRAFWRPLYELAERKFRLS
ncbi:MAG: sulfonate ABC transporter permease [Devosia sp. 67-54]|uniref:ABC transporter permease n=1 Tax=unclassified Devosia TaxID=196773 RepID=UPI00095F7D86|nr:MULTISPECIES: ABC transporter permease subunit [unclassified Devosia]MBN9305897.1 ABC transporter permease subunit [Devosia sp.]OJX16409.1 MAG: sulfonate ABC transporter permease [Devosia sp. 67-54]